MGKHYTKGVLVNPFYGTHRPIWFIGWVLPYLCERSVKNHQFGKKVLPGIFLSYVLNAGNLEGRHSSSRHWRVGADGRVWTPRPKAQCKGSVNAEEKWKICIPSRRWNGQNVWWRSTSETIHRSPGQSRTRRETSSSSRRIRRTLFSIPTTSGLNSRWCGS